MKIKTININAFRGIPEMELDLQEKSLLLQGENGTGKSSIIDAIEFFFTGKISHLPNQNFTSLKKYGTNVGSSPEDLKVEIEINPGGCIVERTFSSSPTCPTSFEDEFRIAKNGRFILRRFQILKFIESTPGKRYEIIGDVLGVEKLDETEKEILNAQKHLKEKVDRKSAEIERIKQHLNTNFEENVEDILTPINKLLEKESLDPIESIDEIKYYSHNLMETIKSANQEKINALDEISNKIENISSINNAILQEFGEAEDLKREILEMHEISDLSLIEILKNSKKILSEDTEICPLCENKIEGEKLLTRIDERLDALETLKDKNKKLKDLLMSISDHLKLLIGDLDFILNSMNSFPEIHQLRDDLKLEIDGLNAFLKSFNFQSFLQGKINNYNELKKYLEGVLVTIKEKSEELKGSLKSSEKDERLENICEMLLDVYKNLEELKNLSQKLETFQSHLEIAEKIYLTFSAAKKRKIQEVYHIIEEDIQRYYNTLHPQELQEDIQLNIDERRRASTNLKMKIFGREDEDPRALSSEGHLDSLGLCIFLALFKKFNEGFPLMVLDDVVTTIDSRHRENVCKLLFEEFGDKQLILTTHDGIWFEQLRAAQRAYNMSNNFLNKNIIKWNLEDGPIIRPYVDRWERIQVKIDEGDRNCAGNEGRRYLEWLLEDMCKKTNTPLPITDSGKYMVNDLIDPVRKRLEKLIKDQEFKEKVSTSFQNLERTIIMGNILSHNGLLEGNVSIYEVDRFCRSVYNLHELMTCPNCKNIIQYYPDLMILRCPNRKCSNPMEIKTK